MAKVHVTTTINGEPMEFLCEPDDTMLDALRGPLALTGSKEGCASGDCGACSITLDDRLICSCLMLAVEAQGHEIRTIEGMANGEKFAPNPVNEKKTTRADLIAALRERPKEPQLGRTDSLVGKRISITGFLIRPRADAIAAAKKAGAIVQSKPGQLTDVEFERQYALIAATAEPSGSPSTSVKGGTPQRSIEIPPPP